MLGFKKNDIGGNFSTGMLLPIIVVTSNIIHSTLRLCRIFHGRTRGCFLHDLFRLLKTSPGSTSDLWPLTSDLWPMTANLWPLTSDRWPMIVDLWPLTPDHWPPTSDLWPLISDLWPLTSDLYLLHSHWDFHKQSFSFSKYIDLTQITCPFP